MSQQPISVSELNRRVKTLIECTPAFSNVCVVGEISNCKLYPSGHRYFSLKDSESTLSCVMFKGSSYTLRNFKPDNGILIRAYGRISVYERDGKYQLIVERMEPLSEGDLQAAFEQLKAKLEKEGLFDEAHKKPLPDYPEKICIITSPAGAAVHDIIRILGARWPLAEVTLVPSRVQGAEAPGELIEALQTANEKELGDLIIIGRGGGSVEDLWAFNDENLARAIYASKIPVISAVGHEPDVTISDYVADRRASTPSNAAEIAVPDCRDIYALLEGYKLRLNPEDFINARRQDLDRYRDRLTILQRRILSEKKEQFLSCAAALDAMSPLKVLSRGYSVAIHNGTCVKSASQLNPGDEIQLRFSEGYSQCRVLKSQLTD